MTKDQLDVVEKRAAAAEVHTLIKAAQSPQRAVHITNQGCFLAKSESLGEQLRRALTPMGGDVVPFRKVEPSRPITPPPQGPKPGTRLPLAATSITRRNC